MSMRQGRPSSLDGIKRYAKAIKSEKGLQHARALDEAATLAGFQNFAHAKRALASEGPRVPGRQSTMQPSPEGPRRMTNAEFLDRARAHWVRSIDKALGGELVASKTWTELHDIEDALSHVMGSGRNHAHLPDGGGRDFTAVEPSHEPGCLDFEVGPRTIYRMKPRRLILERFEADPAQSFLLLELATLKTSGTYESYGPTSKDFGQEELVEVGLGELYERWVWDEGVTPDGEDLPSDAKLLVRFLGGKVLFVTVGSHWNQSPSTYGGEHARLEAADIRSVVERWMQD